MRGNFTVKPNIIRPELPPDADYFKSRQARDPVKEDAAVMRNLVRIYRFSDREALNHLIENPNFAFADHKKLIRETAEALECDEKVAKDVIKRSAPFHMKKPKKAVDRCIAIGSSINLSADTVRRLLILKPRIGTYSDRWFSAVLEVCDELSKEGISRDARMLRAWFRHMDFPPSPYVQRDGGLSISEARRNGEYSEPKLMTVLRKELAPKWGDRQ